MTGEESECEKCHRPTTNTRRTFGPMHKAEANAVCDALNGRRLAAPTPDRDTLIEAAEALCNALDEFNMSRGRPLEQAAVGIAMFGLASNLRAEIAASRPAGTER